MKAISVRQPWAWLLFHGKGVENRSWRTSYRGRLAIHAAKTMTQEEWNAAVLFVASFDRALSDSIPVAFMLPLGAVVGTVEQYACVALEGRTDNPWFTGPYGHVYRDAAEYADPIPARGYQGLWEWAEPKMFFLNEAHELPRGRK